MRPENAVDRRFGKGCVARAEKECQIFREMSDSIRADKWLWAARFFKTRALAGEILGDGKVKRNGHVLKRSSSIQPGDVLEIPFVEGPGLREIVVTKVIEKRVGAPEAQACYEERTKPEVFEVLKNWQIAKAEAAKGRPTKKDRRAIDKIKEAWEWDA
jgi:ribosome-associated heat shock protein Hsp15